jgi:hypothetical protein
MPRSENPVIASDGLSARPVGPWVLDKKHYLERYLKISTTAVGKKWNGMLAYVDLFSGPGRSLIRGTKEEVDAFPRCQRPSLRAWIRSPRCSRET